MANYLVLSGVVCQTLIRNVSPSGIPHCQFMLEHKSSQKEAGFPRQAWCQMPIIVSGFDKQNITYDIIVGSSITVHGFISCHKLSNGLTRIVLHAKRIKLIK